MALAQFFDGFLCVLLYFGDDAATLLRGVKIRIGCVNGRSKFYILGLLNFGGNHLWVDKRWIQLLQQFLLFEVDLHRVQTRLN